MPILIVVLAAAFFLSPLAALFSQIHWQELSSILLDPSTLSSLKATLITSLGGAIISICIGYYFARFFAYSNWKGKRYFQLTLLLPYLVPNFVLAMAWVLTWNPTTGLFNSILPWPGPFYGYISLMLAKAVVHVPLTFLLISEALKRIDGTLLEAGQIAGASPLSLLLKIELPLIKSVIFSALLLCFALNTSAFAIPAWLGAPGRVYTLTYKIYQDLQLGGQDGIPAAAALSLLLFGLALIPLLFRFKGFALTGAKSQRAPSLRFSLLSKIAFKILFFTFSTVFVLVPILFLILSTLVTPGCLQAQGMSCLQQASLHNYHYVLFELDETRQALVNTTQWALMSSFIIVSIAVLATLISSKSKTVSSFFERCFQIPLSTPGAIIALGMIVLYSGRFGLNFYNTATMGILAFIIKHQSLAFEPVKNGIRNISTTLLEAARVSGSSPLKTLIRITLPIARPEILGAFFLVLIPILGELTMSVFLASPQFRPIGVVLFELQDYADQNSAASLAVILVVLCLTLNQTARFLSRGKLGY